MAAADPNSSHRQPESLRVHGFAEPGAERALDGLVHLAAALGEGQAALALRDEKSVWLCAGSGFEPAAWASLEPVFTACATGPMGAALGPGGPWVLGSVDLAGARGQSLGRLWALTPGPRAWSAQQRTALTLLAGQIQLLVELQRERAETRTQPRGPAGSSFVPGLVHEMRNFVFGITGSLDAFRARFGERPELARYETVMRQSLDRLIGFVDELGDYGDPSELAWTDRDLELLLREAVEYQRPRVAADGGSLRLELQGPLPAVRVDEQSLVKAFIRLIELALGRPGDPGQATVRAAAGLQGGLPVASGEVEGARLNLPGLDLARLFEPFYFRAAGFSRLALPVARRVFERHGGSLRAELGPGGGLRLCFTLPALPDGR